MSRLIVIMPGWRAECTVCEWRSVACRTEYGARHAGAQHLWAMRGAVHVFGDPSLCPTPGKRRHRSQEEALQHIRSLYTAGRGNPDYRPYRCACGAWHVGHDVRSLTHRIRLATHGRR